MHRIQALLIGLILVFSGIARADYVAQNGGHGPFDASSGTIYDRGEIEMWYPSGPGVRWVGNMGSLAYVVHPAAQVIWLETSPHYTYAVAYEFETYPGSFSGRNYVVTSSWVNHQFDGWSPAAIVVRYYPPCPVRSGYTIVHACSGSYTPYDDTGNWWTTNLPIPTVVIADGAVQPGLPYGNPLKLTPAADGAGLRVECLANLADYGLGSGEDVAVYGCP